MKGKLKAVENLIRKILLSLGGLKRMALQQEQWKWSPPLPPPMVAGLWGGLTELLAIAMQQEP